MRSFFDYTHQHKVLPEEQLPVWNCKFYFKTFRVRL